VNEVDDEHRKRLEHEVQSMMEELKTPHPVVYLRHGTEIPVAFSIIPLHHLSGVTPRQFDDIHHAIRYFVTRRHSTDMAVEQKEKLTRSLRRRREQALRAIEAVRTDLADASRADEYERYGSILMAHLDVVTKGMNRVEIRDGADIVRIPIDVRRTAVQNAQRYFEKAKRSRSARRQSGERLKELENVEASASRLLTELDRIASKDDIKEFMSTHARKLEDFGIVSEGKEEERLLFRVFDVEGGFQVWAGKNEANNDLLTLKHAKPHDLWFHARGSGGSHVVLKVGTGKGTPGKQAREQAAGIAAYYSKMKNAKVVPVVMTEKKYVRKPKGAPPGSVIVERERVIFAEPRLPDQKRRPIG
jgi:predicted ribosome quality control (RQC) complex YloA/Tae2 family protein